MALILGPFRFGLGLRRGLTGSWCYSLKKCNYAADRERKFMSATFQDTGWPRATKIVATLGNVSSTPEILRRLCDAGVNVFRLNFSHGTRDEQGRELMLLGR